MSTKYGTTIGTFLRYIYESDKPLRRFNLVSKEYVLLNKKMKGLFQVGLYFTFAIFLCRERGIQNVGVVFF